MNAPATAITAPLAERDSGPDPAGEMIPRTCADAVNIYEAFASGSPVIVTARGDAGFEAHMCFAGESFGTDAAAFLVRHTSGFVLATVPEEVMVRTGLTLMTPGFDRDGGRFCVAVDASAGVTTGISGADRAHTIGLLADPEARTDHFVRPGHVIPIAVGGAFSAARWSIYDSMWSMSLSAGLNGVVATASVVNEMEELDEAFVSALARRLGIRVVDVHDLGVERCNLASVSTALDS
ncbi:3,4-dihydroxy-2-butanone 4-phosphate synthase [Gordonia westfalica]|uniref:3,4-dihydroxy-2-butanone-4-phosphate synthase n=2 Tax=Gordonia westfalica TaxID=158898 RepID=A0A1H2IPT7_9ACTN|nr:3,4-dihydroxy-2-butanone 4-phosphate synthase [Gordonia westfalica]